MQSFSQSHGIFHLINNHHNAAGDVLFGVISGLGDGLVVALACTLLMLFRLHLGGAALAAFAVSGLITQLLKRMFDLPRPPAVLANVHVLGDTLTAHSFPSGHATSCGVMALLAFLIWKRSDWRAWVVSCLFLLAAYGRIYGGVHFPLDVAVGLAVGIVTMWAFWQWSKRWPAKSWELSPWAWKFPGLAMVIEADVLAMGYHIQPS
ncbi:MAG: phosphatase PAP2 family protein, partial [Mariprofundaceae bacterium]|nr:phosphatase PAP2 family protein [Mariprofundaceae bacterium]